MMNRITDPGETKSTKKVLGRVAMKKTPQKHGRSSFLTSLSLCRFLYIPPKFKFSKEEGRERRNESYSIKPMKRKTSYVSQRLQWS